jgi:hypothetical protein
LKRLNNSNKLLVSDYCMRLLIFTILLFASQTVFGQSRAVDSLLARLNNRLIVAGGDYFTSKLEFRDGTIDTLAIIGKPIAKKLYSLLDDTSRGVASHVVLSFIYQPSEFPKVSYLERLDLTQYTVGNLTFLMDHEKAFASKDKLIKNKAWWRLFLSKISR